MEDFFRNKIWIIASGSLDCFPKPGCKDLLCEMARKGGKDRRLCATSVFWKGVLFDIGPGVWDRISSRRIRPKAIVLSHVHYDHLSGLMKLPSISRSIPVYASSLTRDLLEKLGIKARYFEPNETFSPTKNLKIETKVGIHTFTRPVSILKFDHIVYAPDLGEVRNSDLKFARDAEIWLGDGHSFEEDFIIQGEKLHLAGQKLLLALKPLKKLRLVLFLGISHATKWPHEDLELIAKSFAINKELPFAVEIGFDNQLLSP